MTFERIAASLLVGGVLSVTSVVASAALVDLRSGMPGGPYATGTINGATYTFGETQPAGSGVIDPFVRISTNQTTVQGYNTTTNNVFDTGNTDTFNHEITVGQVGFMGTDAFGNGGFMRFLLDINQIGSPPSSYLSLDEIQVFISATPNQGIETFAANGEVDLSGRATVYRMDGGVDGPDSQVLLDYDWNSGSGESDMTLELTRSMFDSAFATLGLATDAAKNGAYIYLYSKFGLSYSNNDGYEEWAYKAGAGVPIGCIPSPENNFCRPQDVPEPGVLPLVALGLVGVAGLSTRRRRFV